jgi:hypothetical protein
MSLEVGEKYSGNYSIEEIMDLIDGDIQKAIKRGEIVPFKYHIHKKRLGWTPEIIVKVLSIPKPFLKYEKGEKTKEFEKFENKLEEIGKVYDKTDSEIMADYYETKYYFDIQYSDKVFPE